ncbi:MAG: hypothetical protein H7101_08705, partial [Deinococcales bacterium]|nr:hypothetical protein [Chitinophagaceae bacterium]
MNKQFYKIYSFVFCSLLLILSCTKETSFESGNLFGSAEGTLKDSTGNCQGISIKGQYVMDSVLTDSNYVTITATITKPGNYKIYSDTVNGFWFRDSAFVLTAGVKTFKLKGYGKPILPKTANFTVLFNASACLFSITVTTTAGGGGGGNTPTAPSGDYFPITPNSNWTYDYTSNPPDTIRYTSKNFTATVNNKVYRIFTTNLGDTLAYRKDSLQGEYFAYSRFANDSRPLDYKFLDDKLPVNSFWETDTISTVALGFPTTYKIRFTIDAKNASYIINGNALDSVIKVKQEVFIQVPGGLFTKDTRSTFYT